MGWARMDDGFHDHPKVDPISLTAVGMWTLCLSWAHRHRRKAVVPGHVPQARVDKVGGKQAAALAAELVATGLWEVEPNLGGFLIHDFADYLPKERDPDERREAGRNGAAKRWQGHSKPDSKLPTASMGSDSSRASAPASPTRPVPEEQSNTEGEQRPLTLTTSHATGRPRCSTHPDGNYDGRCGGCAKVREWDERQATQAAERARTETLERARNCRTCEGMGFHLNPDKTPTRRKCDHRVSV